MTVQAERLNFLRFLSHFRAVHRGASFAGLRTTSVRKLLPEYVVSLSVVQLLHFHENHLSFHIFLALPTIFQILGFPLSCSHT